MIVHPFYRRTNGAHYYWMTWLWPHELLDGSIFFPVHQHELGSRGTELRPRKRRNRCANISCVRRTASSLSSVWISCPSEVSFANSPTWNPPSARDSKSYLPVLGSGIARLNQNKLLRARQTHDKSRLCKGLAITRSKFQRVSVAP